MRYLNSFKKHNWEKENLLCESSYFNQFSSTMGSGNLQSPMPGYAFATNPSLGIYTGQDSPYVDLYSRTQGFVSDLKSIVDTLNKDKKGITAQKFDYFIEDLEFYDNFKILRILKNDSNYLNVFISFEFNEEEYFGSFKDFNKPYYKPTLNTELFKSGIYPYINEEYKLKLSNYFIKILNNWFIPNSGQWKNLKNGLKLKTQMGNIVKLKENSIFEVIGYNIDDNNNPFIIIEYKEDIYYINNENYYYFKWFCEKI
jgi:hypothetical protein